MNAWIKGVSRWKSSNTNEININYSYSSCELPGGLTCIDFDGDGWDDLSFGSCPEEPVLVHRYLAEDQVFEIFNDNLGLLQNETQKSSSV